jgi:hypothetical protein
MKNEVQSNLQNEHEETGLSQLSKLWLIGDDVCRILRISKRTLQNYRNNYILPFSKTKKKIYYKASDIDEYLNQHYIKANYQKGGRA